MKTKLSAFNPKHEINDFDDARGIVESFLNVLYLKADSSYIRGWNYSKFLDFVFKVKQVVDNNRDTAKSQKEELKALLKNPLYLQAAYIAQDVYMAQPTDLPGGWRRSMDFADIEFCSKANGFVSCLYEKVTNGHKDYIYATAGTDPENVTDWKNNIDQLYGQSEQYEAAANNAIELSERIGNAASLTFVGHSLGGGLAINNSIHTGRQAIVFNPAAVSSDTIKDACNVSANTIDKNIIVFQVTDDILGLLQDTAQLSEGLKLILPAACGKRYYINNKVVLSPIKSHRINQVIEKLEDLIELP